MENFDIKLQSASNAEFISREIFEYELKKHNLKYKFTEDRFNAIDCYIYDNKKTYAVELKYRPNYSSSSFNSIMMEDKKYYQHIKLANDNKLIPLYIVMFNDGYYYMINLNNITPNFTPIKLNEKSYSNYGSNNKMTKYIYYIPKNKFKEYQYNANYILTEKEKEKLQKAFR